MTGNSTLLVRRDGHVTCMSRACAVHVKWNKDAVSIAMIDKKHGIARVRGSHKHWNSTPRARSEVWDEVRPTRST